MDKVILPVIKGQTINRTNGLTFAHSSQLALQDGKYKLYADSQVYELYDMHTDSLETTNIIDKHPELAQTYKTTYTNWINNVKSSFNGDEYGTETVEKLNQKNGCHL